jgi:replicative superfamily II helicase
LLGAVDLLSECVDDSHELIDHRLLDEIHHLADDRGATLEAIVVRMRTLNDIYHLKVSTKKRNK